jgi:serine protease AprX
MKNSALLAVLSVCLTSYMPAAATEHANPIPEATRIMLQGSSAAGLRQLVETSGGTVTHDLHIINAVGALLTPAQLEEVLKSPLVDRHIDDLSISTPPTDAPSEQEKSCDVGGALELQYSTAGISWLLHNKHHAPARLQRLELSWPSLLGPVEKISLGDSTLASSVSEQTAAGSLELDFSDPDTPSLTGATELRVQFKSPPGLAADLPLRQRDFVIKASFTGDCSTSLIAGYDNNDEDFYYASVAGADALHRHGVTGKGVTVAVLDSGLWEHPALATDTEGKPRVLARYDAITNTTPQEVFDASGHGTHMTSVIAHSGPTTTNGVPTGSFKGIAPDVNLVTVKAFDVEGQGDFLDIVRGVQWVVDHRETYNIKVLNLSFGARPRWNYWLDPINQAVMRAWASGITVIAAAGNVGPDPMTISAPGNLPYVITVGAVTDSWTPLDRDDDYIPDFSSRGPTPNAHIKPDLVAPGGHITGLTRPGSMLTQEHPNYVLKTGEFVMTGSSQASALVSGIVAILLQLEPDLTPDDIKCKLLTSAEPAINRDGLLAYSPFQQGHGYVNATRAVTLGKRGCGNPGLDIQREIEGKEHFQGPAIVDNGSASLPGLTTMVSPQPSEQGASKSRKWGVKAHIERNDSLSPVPGPENEPPFNWQELYLEEKVAIEKLAREKQ